jgi:hypothetical protein
MDNGQCQKKKVLQIITHQRQNPLDFRIINSVKHCPIQNEMTLIKG